jgi:hypothetical protein
MKTMHGQRRRGRLRRPCEVTAMTACSDATTRWDDAAAGRESMERRENHQRRTCRRRHIGSRQQGPKAVTLWPEEATSGNLMLERRSAHAQGRTWRRRVPDRLIRPTTVQYVPSPRRCHTDRNPWHRCR